MRKRIFGVILAAGKGTRFKAGDRNKTSVLFNNQPLVNIGATLLEDITEKTYVVIGAHAESVKHALKDKNNIFYAQQEPQLGTGHALHVAIEQMEKDGTVPTDILVGMGDHMMFYTKNIVNNLIAAHREKSAVLSLLTTQSTDPNTNAWGRIERDTEGNVKDIIEYKDATDEQRKITEVNPGFYCFSYTFIKDFQNEIHKSSVTGEYYLTEYIAIATKHHLPIGTVQIPFKNVGIGINSQAELVNSERMFTSK